MYTYEFTSKSLKQLKKLDRQTQKAILEKLDFFCKQELLLNVEHLTDRRIGNYRFRVGDYRVVFDIDGKMVTILAVGHRSSIYK